MTIDYKINGVPFSTYGIKVSASEGLFDLPEVKDPVVGDWKEQHGHVVNLGLPTVTARKIKLTCWMSAVSTSALINQSREFYAKFIHGGLQQLLVTVTPTEQADIVLPFMVYAPTGIQFSKRFGDGEALAKFDLILIEPEPIKKVLKAALGSVPITSVINLTTVYPINIYWGDGTHDLDIMGDDINTPHTYTVRKDCFIVLTGRVDLIDSIGWTSEISELWSML